jgi:hypothetical protein
MITKGDLAWAGIVIIAGVGWVYVLLARKLEDMHKKLDRILELMRKP